MKFFKRKKIKVEDLKCYPEVARVIGEVAAKTELFKAANSAGFRGNESKLVTSFMFSETPQGYMFWKRIQARITFGVKHAKD